MRPLLDAHALIWALDDPSRLGPQAVIELKNTANQLVLRAGIIWELAIGSTERLKSRGKRTIEAFIPRLAIVPRAPGVGELPKSQEPQVEPEFPQGLGMMCRPQATYSERRIVGPAD